VSAVVVRVAQDGAEADVADEASGFFGEAAEACLGARAFVAAVLGGSEPATL
jgi:hypothetical protein